MDSATQHSKQWYDVSQFTTLLHQEYAYWQRLLAHYDGMQTVVQVGGVAGFAEQVCPPGQSIVAVAGCADATIRANVLELPLTPNSCDLILMPHTLEGTKHPEQCIEEAAMALAPNGLLILSVLNRQSWYGLCRRYQKNLRQMPSRQYFVALKVLRWLSKSGLAVEQQKGIGFRPPLNNPSLQESLRFLDVLGHLAWPQWSNSVVFVARKNIHGMTKLMAKGWDKQFAMTSMGYKS